MISSLKVPQTLKIKTLGLTWLVGSFWGAYPALLGAGEAYAPVDARLPPLVCHKHRHQLCSLKVTASRSSGAHDLIVNKAIQNDFDISGAWGGHGGGRVVVPLDLFFKKSFLDKARKLGFAV